MKTIKLIVLGIVLMFAGTANAQVSVNLNFGSPPMWGPAGYSDVHYYYLPDVQAYYDINASMFIYQSGGIWVHRSYLPTRYRNYDLYNGYKVVMTDYHGNRPYANYREYRTKYARGYRGHEQQHNIGSRPERGNENRSYKQARQDNNRSRNVGRSEGRNQNQGRGNENRGNNGGQKNKGGHDNGGGKGRNK